MGSKTRNSIPIGNPSAHKRLPRNQDIAAVTRDADRMRGGVAGTGQLCVLVVVDDASAAESLSMMVKTWGHRVEVASDGGSAVKIASAIQADVVLLDIVMPKMDGCQAARRLRRQPHFQDTLLIGLMGSADREHRPRAEQAGFDLCLMKPVEPSTLEVLLLLEHDWLTQPPAPLPNTPRKNTSKTDGWAGG